MDPSIPCRAEAMMCFGCVTSSMAPDLDLPRSRDSVMPRQTQSEAGVGHGGKVIINTQGDWVYGLSVDIKDKFS